MTVSPPFAVVFDFDGTLLPKHHLAAMRIIEVRLYSPEGLAAVDAMGAQNRRKIIEGTISREESVKGWKTTHDLYANEGITLEKARSALSDVCLRPGAADCLRRLKEHGIPTAIISCGVEAFIPIILEMNGVADCVTEVRGSRIGFDVATGELLPYVPHCNVSSFDKGCLSQAFAARRGIPPERILAVGDSLGDRRLGWLRENRLGIAQDDAEAVLLVPHMGHVIVTEDFAPVTAWLFSHLGPA